MRYPTLTPAPWLSALLYGVCLAILASRAPLRTIGDAGEYLAYALTISHGHGPALTDASIAQMRTDIAAFDPELSRWPALEEGGRRSADGRRDFIHFWLYPAFASPWVAAARAAGLDPRLGFTVLNIALLMIAFAVAWRRLGWALTILLLAGPIIWWSNKVHVEAFVVSLTAIGLTIWQDRPGVAMACAGLAAAQVPPIAMLIPMIAAATIVRRTGIWRTPSFLAGLAGGTLAAVLPSAYYFSRFGIPSLLADFAQPHWPSAAEFGAVLWDLNVGLLVNWPFLAIAAIVALARAATEPRPLVQPDVLMAAGLGLVLMLAFPQIGNFTHGATPGVMRYGIWLTPLAIPILAAASADQTARRGIGLIAILSLAFSLKYYDPAVEEFAHRPTGTALWVWRHAPSWSNPLPEVFARSLDRGSATVPIHTPGCHKILLVGRGEHQGMWPRPCPPAEVPDQCREPGAACYANRSGRTYTFRPLPSPLEWLKYNPESVWPRRAEAGVGSLMAKMNWWKMRSVQPEAPGGLIAFVQGARLEHAFAAESRFVFVLRDVQPEARLELRTNGLVHGLLVDGETGQTLPLPAAEDKGAHRRSLTVPSRHALLVLGVWAGSGPVSSVEDRGILLTKRDRLWF